METFSALLALCAGISPQSFNVFFDLHLNKWLSKQSWGWWFETLSCPLWRHNNDYPVYGRQTFAEFTTSWGAKGQSSYKSNQSTNISTTPGPIALWIFRLTSIFNWNFAESLSLITYFVVDKFFLNFAQSTAVTLPCPVQNFKRIRLWDNKLWVNEILRDFISRLTTDIFPILLHFPKLGRDRIHPCSYSSLHVYRVGYRSRMREMGPQGPDLFDPNSDDSRSHKLSSCSNASSTIMEMETIWSICPKSHCLELKIAKSRMPILCIIVG